MKKTLFACLFIFCLCASGVYAQNNKLDAYVYEDTKQLVMLVENAAGLIEQKGEAAFNDFGVKGSRWFNDNSYLFIYDVFGKCVFHPIEPGLVGQDLSMFRDIDKRPVIAMISDIANKPQRDANGWVFYLWEEQWGAHPRWKSSYIRKAIAPDGKVYLVGSGLYNMKMEKEFIRERVDLAAQELSAKSKDAVFNELNDRACPLHILDSYISVLDKNGDVIVDPAFPGLAKKRNMNNFVDKAGRNITREIVDGLKDKDSMWLLYIWPKDNANHLTRYLLYVRKVVKDGEVYYISSDYAPARPIWMKQ